MEEPVKLRRITYKLKCPNPLFTKWVQEWKDEADKNNLKTKHVFAVALESLKKFPLPLETGQDCAILQGFGKTLCSLLDDKIEEYNKMIKHTSVSSEESIDLETMEHSTCLPNVEPPVTENLEINNEVFKISNTEYNIDSNPQSNTNYNIDTSEKRSIKQKNVSCMNVKLYSPSYRSGAYAILVTLRKSLNNELTYMNKQEIQTKAQLFCDKSFTNPETGSRYTAWSSMSSLITKGLVSKSGNPPKFSLTDEGAKVAEQLLKKYVDLIPNENNSSEQNADQEIPQLESGTSVLQKDSEFDVAIFSPNTFETILLVDTQETSGFAKKAYDETIHELNQCNVKFEIRRLNVGDFTWVCRDETKRELILPYIVERKRMDDFGSSIRDGRFREQKFRLKHCGVQNLLYLIESYGRNEHTGLPLSTLMQAACNTSVQDGFTIKFTNNHRDSIMYLALMTRLLKDNMSNKTLVSCPKENLKKFTFDDDIIALMKFIEFQNISIKTKHYTVQNMFIKQLIQIKGVSIDKAIGIVTRYPTPLCLYKAYKENPLMVKEKLLANVPFGPLRKNIGPSISEIIYQLFTFDKY